MEEKKNILTDKGLKRFENELQELRVVKRKEIAQIIKEAREQGDLSENAEYKAAKKEQGIVEARIEELESILKNVEVIYTKEIDIDKVSVGCVVTVKKVETKKVEVLKLVGSTEADVMKNKISNESVIGAALMGQKVGSKVEVVTPNGTVHFEILEIAIDEEDDE